MRKRSIALALTLAAAAGAALAQAPPAPGPEHARLAYFVGEWRAEGMMMESPFGPGGKMTSEDTCEWFEGKLAVVCRSKGKTPMGPMTSMGIIGYSPMDKVYTYYGVDSMGQPMMTVPRGTVDGKVWTYLDESKMGGMTVKSRYVLTEVSQQVYTFKWEVEGEGGKWTTVMDGRMTRK